MREPNFYDLWQLENRKPRAERVFTVTTTSNGKPCEHKSGWYVYVDFWIFCKKLYVCSDCGEVINKIKWGLFTRWK